MRGAGAAHAVTALYEAAAGEAPWDAAGEALRRLVGGRTVSLSIGSPGAGSLQMLCTTAVPDPAWAARAYTERFHALDVWTIEGVRRARRGAQHRVWLGSDLVDEDAFRKSEFHRDFARHLGVYHIVGACIALGRDEFAPLGLHRPEDAKPFEAVDCVVLERVLPHLRRALQLHRQLGAADSELGAAALDALPIAALVLDADLRLRWANASAVRLLASHAALRTVMAAGAPGAPVFLGALHRGGAAALARLVRDVALGGGAGGGVQLHAPDAGPPLAALVSPLPRRLRPPVAIGTGSPPLALVLLREAAQPPRPEPHVVAGMLGLTRAEAEVATALAGGHSAESVAAARRVGIGTVRAQIRAILDKTGAVNLRDLERIIAGLPSATGRDEPTR